MHPFFIWNAAGESLLFLFVVLAFFYLPGKWILSKFRLTMLTPECFVIPIAVGVMAFTLAAYITSWLNASFLVLILIAAMVFAQKNVFTQKITFDKKQVLPFGIVALLSILFSLPRTVAGIWGTTFAYGGDDILHLSYIHELIAHFPPDNPGFAGTPLKGYHFFSDFFIAQIHKLSGISVESLYYHFVPVLVVFLIGFGIYSLVFAWTKRVSSGLWAVLLTMFGGGFGFVLRLQGHTGVSLASVFGIDQPASTMLNSPFAFSLVLVTAALLCIYHYAQTKKSGWLWLLALVVGLSPLFKIYAGIVLAAGITILTALEIVRKRYAVIPPYLTAIILAFATYGLFSGSGNYILLLPLWPPHRMLQANLPWYGYDEKLYTYSRLGVIRGLVEIEAYGLLLFLFGNLGTRILGVIVGMIAWIRNRKAFSLFSMTLAGMLGTAIGIPLFFIQSVKVFEIIQMTWYYPFFASLFAAYGLGFISKVKLPVVRWLLVAALVVTTLPSTYETFTKNVFTKRTRIQLSAFAPYQYLRTHGTYDDTVLELPPASVENTQRDIVAWYRGSSSKFAALGNKRSYFNTLEIDFPNLDIDGRAQNVQDIRSLASSSGSLKESEIRSLQRKLSDLGIRYLYSTYQIHPLTASTLSIQEVFRSPSEVIYRVQ